MLRLCISILLAFCLLPLLCSAQHHRVTGHAYLDESYKDDAGVLHIVISPQAVSEWQSEWPNTDANVSIIAAKADSNAAKDKAKKLVRAAGLSENEADAEIDGKPFAELKVDEGVLTIEGFGTYVTPPVTLPPGVCPFVYAGTGDSNFVVYGYGGTAVKELLVNEIGKTSGMKLLETGDQPKYFFTVESDGLWSLGFPTAPIPDSLKAKP